MKKKIFTTVTAVAMSLAMATSAMAAPTMRESGNVDGNSSVNSNDSSLIRQALVNNTEIDNGNFDGDWNATDFQMTGNGQKVLKYVLTPEKMSESIGLRAYATGNSMTSAGFGTNVIKLYDDLQLESDKVEWNGNYNDYEAPLTAESNYTVDEVLMNGISKIDASADAMREFGAFLSGVGFEGFGKNAGKDVYLTTDEGWGVFAVAMRDIVPIKAEYFEASGYTGNIDKVFDGDYGVIDEPYTDINALPADLKTRAEAFEAMHDIIVTNAAHEEGVNDTTIGKTSTVTDLYEQFKLAFPSDVTEEEFAKTCDHFGEIYTRRYTVTVSDKDGSETIDGNVNDDNTTAFVNKLISSGIYHYETATLQDVRDTFGDKIELSTTKDGEKTWGFVLELYVRYN